MFHAHNAYHVCHERYVYLCYARILCILRMLLYVKRSMPRAIAHVTSSSAASSAARVSDNNDNDIYIYIYIY